MQLTKKRKSNSIKFQAAILGRFFVAQTPTTMRLPMTARSRPEDIEYISRLKFGSQFSLMLPYNLKPFLPW